MAIRELEVEDTLYYVKSVDPETGAFKLATGSATGSDVTLTLLIQMSSRFYQVKLMMLAVWWASKFGSCKFISIVLNGNAALTATVTHWLMDC